MRPGPENKTYITERDEIYDIAQAIILADGYVIASKLLGKADTVQIPFPLNDIENQLLKRGLRAIAKNRHDAGIISPAMAADYLQLMDEQPS